MHALHGEALRRDCAAEQVAIIEQESLVARAVDWFAVIHGDEGRITAQALGHALGNRRARGRVGAFHAGQDQARNDAVA